MISDNKLRVALYLRLSDEDRCKLNDFQLSESIKNQKRMLVDYANDNGWKIVGIYNDEDYSGADDNRPEFNKLLKVCENRMVDIVLCKTQSRFTRDMEIVEKYLHNKFREWNIRFIGIVDNADTANIGNKKQRQINGLINEWYLEDTSINIRETLRNKRENGQFTGSFAPYGYMRDPLNKNHLIPDFVAALVVKRIFIEYSNGYGLHKIVTGLSNDNILSPLEYKRMNNCKLKIPITKKYNDLKYINKTGNYIISVNYFNNTGRILSNLVTINFLTSNFKDFSDVVTIKLIKNDNKSLKIYYSLTKLEDLDIRYINNNCSIKNIDFNDGNWIEIDNYSDIPNDVSCIATYVENLDRMNDVSYELEVKLKENKNKLKYFYQVFSFIGNDNQEFDFNIKIRNKYRWNEQTIKRILKDEVYIGNLVQFKTTNVSYKNKKIIYNDESIWIRSNDTHEAIVAKDVWDNVQKRIKNRRKSCKSGRVHLLAGKVFCENCGRLFCKCGKNNSNGYSYLCCKEKNNKWANCNNTKYIKEEDLHQFIIDKFNDLIDKFYNFDLLLKINDDVVDNNIFKEKIKGLENEEFSINEKLDKKSNYLQNLYEDFKNGIIDNNEYNSLKEKYRDDISFLNNRIRKLKKELDDIYNYHKELKNNTSVFIKYKRISILNHYIVDNFIEKVIIGNYDNKNNQRKVKIIWNFK